MPIYYPSKHSFLILDKQYGKRDIIILYLTIIIDLKLGGRPGGLIVLLHGSWRSCYRDDLNQFIVPASSSLQDEPYIMKMWTVFISGKVALWRYITVWLIAVSSTSLHQLAQRANKDKLRMQKCMYIAGMYTLHHSDCKYCAQLVQYYGSGSGLPSLL